MDMRTDSTGRAEVSWDLLIRVSGIALFALLIIAYATGEEYPHTHRMIGYGMAVLLAVGIFWLAVRSHDGRLLPISYSPRLITAQLRHADGLAKTLMSLFFVLARFRCAH
jgi:cytochrome b